MINKLANTNQKLSLLKSSDKEDVLNFLRQTGGSSRGRNSKGKLKTKLRNVHSINAEAMSIQRPQMAFINRSTAFDYNSGFSGNKLPNVSYMNKSTSRERISS